MLRPRPVSLGSLPGVTYWQRRLEEECARAGRYQRPVVLVLVAIQSAPDLLSEGLAALVAESLRSTLRSSDVLCGLTPSRFGILLVETDAAGAQVVVRRLHRSVQRMATQCLPAALVPHLAVAAVPYTPDQSLPSELMAAAEQALQRQVATTATP
jgi:GGDEF domain-containing protein